MFVFSSMSERPRPSQVFRHSKGAGTVANAVDVDAAAVEIRVRGFRVLSQLERRLSCHVPGFKSAHPAVPVINT